MLLSSTQKNQRVEQRIVKRTNSNALATLVTLLFSKELSVIHLSRLLKMLLLSGRTKIGDKQNFEFSIA